MKNGQLWYDVDGNKIQAHAGCIIKHEDTYYWYGEHKGIENRPKVTEVPFVGISCYSSKNLVDWKYEGLALEKSTDPTSPLYFDNCIAERPKVLYNESTKKFVMWTHLDNRIRKQPFCGIAVCDTPNGKFELVTLKRPNGTESRDMTLFKDDDGKAYVVYSSDCNNTVNIGRLTDDYLFTNGEMVRTHIDQGREAPAICKNNGKYYMVSSGCTGWNPNPALYSTAEVMLGKWRLKDNPCEGEGRKNTYGGQSAYIFNFDGTNYLMLDHWEPRDLQNSRYSILPIEFDEKGIMSIKWKDEFNGLEK